MTTTDTPSLTIHHITRKDIVSLVTILLVAAVFRLWDGGRVTEFGYDPATLSILAFDMAGGHSLPLTGIESSAGIPNSPMTVYVLAPMFALTDDPQVIVTIIAAWNVVGVGLLWFIAYRYFSPRVALIAGLAYAVHPHVIHYSRAIWAQDTHTPILLLAFLLALVGFLENRRWAQLAALPLFVIGAQIHYAAWTLLPAFLWIIWTGRKNVHLPSLIGSIALAILTLVPFAIGLSQNVGAASQTASGVVERLDSLALRDKALLYLARMMTGLGGPWVSMDLIGRYDVVLEFPTFVSALWLLVGASVALGVAVMWRTWGRFRAVWLLLWALLPFAVFVPNWIGVYPHYFIPNLPAFALLTGIGVTWLLERLPEKSPARSVAFALFGFVLITQGWVYFAFAQVSDTVKSELSAIPVHYLMDVRGAVSPVRDVIISGGTTGQSGYDVWKALLYRRTDCVRELVIASGGIAIFPAHPFAVITPPDALPPAAGDLYAVQTPVIVPLRSGEGIYSIAQFESAPQWNGTPILDTQPARFDNGVTLTGYRLDGNRVYLRWALPGAGTRSFQYFAHFLDTAGEKIGQQDASFWPERFWCAGDTIITWVETAVPSEIATLRVGFYQQQDGQFINSNTLDEAGNVLSSWADIPVSELSAP
jgi:hypothetical protein